MRRSRRVWIRIPAPTLSSGRPVYRGDVPVGSTRIVVPPRSLPHREPKRTGRPNIIHTNYVGTGEIIGRQRRWVNSCWQSPTIPDGRKSDAQSGKHVVRAIRGAG